jgi:hypothetical protein
MMMAQSHAHLQGASCAPAPASGPRPARAGQEMKDMAEKQHFSNAGRRNPVDN